MSAIKELFSQELKLLNVGAPMFKKELEKQGVHAMQVDWQPPAGGKLQILEALDRLLEDERIKEANLLAVSRLKEAHPVLIDIGYAGEVIPGMTKTTLLHAGPPIEFSRMCGPMKGAIIGALIYEGLAEDEITAETLAASGKIQFEPCHKFGAVGPMAGIISASMPVHVVKNTVHGNLSYATVNEGLGKVLRYGANSVEVIKRLKWIEREFTPVLKQVLAKSGGVDLKSITAQALHMGDECHNRNKAATALLIRELVSFFMEGDIEREAAARAIAFIRENEHYFLNLSMAACKCSLDAAHGIPYSTVVTTMARNGVDFGIRVSGMPEDKWYTGPAQMVQGLLFPGFAEEDANPDIGDSAITETMGIGGFAMGAAPAIVQFVGGTVNDAINYSAQMYQITEGENTSYSLPMLDFRGTAMGIDIRKVVELGIMPVINTGIAHRLAGIGQVGAGLVHPPVECFEKAILEFAQKS